MPAFAVALKLMPLLAVSPPVAANGCERLTQPFLRLGFLAFPATLLFLVALATGNQLRKISPGRFHALVPQTSPACVFIACAQTDHYPVIVTQRKPMPM